MSDDNAPPGFVPGPLKHRGVIAAVTSGPTPWASNAIVTTITTFDANYPPIERPWRVDPPRLNRKERRAARARNR